MASGIRYRYGNPLEEYAEKYFSDMLETSNFDITNANGILTAESRTGLKKFRSEISYIDLCRRYRIIAIDALGPIKVYIIGNKLPDITKILDIPRLVNMRDEHVRKEEFEYADKIQKRISQLRKLSLA